VNAYHPGTDGGTCCCVTDGAVPETMMQSAVANGKLDGQSVHGLYSTTTTAAMWNSACNDESNSTSSAAADCRAIVPMLSGKSINQSLNAVAATHASTRQLKSPAS